MKDLAPGVWRIKEFPGPTINVYLVDDVLIDAGRTWDRRRIFGDIEGRDLSMLALTHVHPDHQGVAKEVCEARGIPLACHADDVDAMEGRRPVQEAAGDNPINRFIARVWQGPPYKVERVLNEEAGSEHVADRLGDALISSMNWSEVAERSLSIGLGIGGLREELEDLGVRVAGFDAVHAELAAVLREPTRQVGLSPADRACLALAGDLGAPALTADRSWADLEVGIEIELIR
ncbi:MAG: MBL fold metallo-hydrolase [Actinomycetota bacterium]|nr:MBL fold metallo-hydrolase [Actinomycetota bacterium]